MLLRPRVLEFYVLVSGSFFLSVCVFVCFVVPFELLVVFGGFMVVWESLAGVVAGVSTVSPLQSFMTHGW